MVQIDATYEGDLNCTAEHVPSGVTLTTDAPEDNHGRGESFSPTDLVATALVQLQLVRCAIGLWTDLVRPYLKLELGAIANCFPQKIV